MTLPKISIITPSFNQGQYLEETILSIISQSYPNLEYIVMDGGSTDNSVEIIKRHQHGISFWVSEPDKGQSDAINKGFIRSTGDVICWLNSDDILMPGALMVIAKAFEKQADIDLINGSLLIIDQNSKILSAHFILKQKKWYAEKGIFYMSQPSMFWRRRIFNATGFLKEEFHAQMDKELLIRIFEANCKIGHLDQFLAGFRKHAASKGAMGVDSSINVRDEAALKELYGGKYVQQPKLFFVLVYGIHKFIKGLYFRKWLFTILWKGKSVRDFNQSRKPSFY